MAGMASTERKRILIVDDSPLMLDMAKEALELAGFTVFIAQNFKELAKFQDDRNLDLILMDVQMPELFGDDVAMVLREVRGVKAPIYLLSSLDANELSERASEAEIDGYICKRDGIDALVERVVEILDESSSQRPNE
jgi:DNA-binding response OmpR family regulator